MGYIRELIQQLEEERTLPRKELTVLLEEHTPEDDRYLYERADRLRRLSFGNQIYIRGLIEFTNYCKNDCLYCGLRRSNSHAERYRLTSEEILDCCRVGYQLGFRTFVLQSGEDGWYTDRRMCDLIAAIKQETRFGVGAAFEKEYRRDHPVMEEDWAVSPVTRVNRDKAWKQLGSSGGGNHFVEFGELHLDEAARIGERELTPGTYLALLSHSGSRGTGEAVALHYSQRAMSLHPDLPEELRRLAWLSLDREEGQEYWAAMQLMGRYASANHELIHRHILKALGCCALTHVENHHNFAWLEEHDGEQVVVHRKGATPADKGRLGVVPGSMCSPAFVVRGKGREDALCSCSHGAGRLMSRAAAFRQFTQEDLAAVLRENGVELLSAGLDESPMAYKDIRAVMKAQQDLVDILAVFHPRLVKMAKSEARRKGR